MQGEMAIVKPEPLESNPELGVYFMQDTQEGDGGREVFLLSQFNRRQRLLVTAGCSYMANLWDLRSDNYNDFKSSSLPHIKSANALNGNTTDVSSVHWNAKGDHLLTSSTDMVARVWKVEDGGEVKIEKVKNFNESLWNSKFNNSEQGNLVATGGLCSTIYVWDYESESCKEVARFEHADIDPNFNGLEIEWQNSKNVAVAGRSKFIYLWSIDNPKSPIQTWEGHEENVEQI